MVGYEGSTTDLGSIPPPPPYYYSILFQIIP